jgi:hypothetical protein
MVHLVDRVVALTAAQFHLQVVAEQPVKVLRVVTQLLHQAQAVVVEAQVLWVR